MSSIRQINNLAKANAAKLDANKDPYYEANNYAASHDVIEIFKVKL